MGMNAVVAGMLRDAGMRDVFTVAVGAAIAPNPTVVLEAGYERDDEVLHGERGRVRVQVLCVRETDTEAFEAAAGCADAIRTGEWERYREQGDWSVCGVDAGYPKRIGRDRSGRHVYRLDVDLTIERDDG